LTGGPRDFAGLIIQRQLGYTVCYARPSAPAGGTGGSGDQGIETRGGSIFNATIVRRLPAYDFDGLAWRMTVPLKSTEARIQATFHVVWVRVEPGWESRYKKCEPTGEHAWLSQNNVTSFNVPCDPREGGWCPER
jgi:hypothetical protein